MDEVETTLSPRSNNDTNIDTNDNTDSASSINGMAAMAESKSPTKRKSSGDLLLNNSSSSSGNHAILGTMAGPNGIVIADKSRIEQEEEDDLDLDHGQKKQESTSSSDDNETSRTIDELMDEAEEEETDYPAKRRRTSELLGKAHKRGVAAADDQDREEKSNILKSHAGVFGPTLVSAMFNSSGSSKHPSAGTNNNNNSSNKYSNDGHSPVGSPKIHGASNSAFVNHLDPDTEKDLENFLRVYKEYKKKKLEIMKKEEHFDAVEDENNKEKTEATTASGGGGGYEERKEEEGKVEGNADNNNDYIKSNTSENSTTDDNRHPPSYEQRSDLNADTLPTTEVSEDSTNNQEQVAANEEEEELAKAWTDRLQNALEAIAKTGKSFYTWETIRAILQYRINHLIKSTKMSLPVLEKERNAIHQLFQSASENLSAFDDFPFTIQRLCELVLYPDLQYTQLIKYARAVQKTTVITSSLKLLAETFPPSTPTPPPTDINSSPNSSQDTIPGDAPMS